jgi:hypothetical protein
VTGKEREDLAPYDREIRVLVGMMLAFQGAFLAVAMLWL